MSASVRNHILFLAASAEQVKVLTVFDLDEKLVRALTIASSDGNHVICAPVAMNGSSEVRKSAVICLTPDIRSVLIEYSGSDTATSATVTPCPLVSALQDIIKPMRRTEYCHEIKRLATTDNMLMGPRRTRSSARFVSCNFILYGYPC